MRRSVILGWLPVLGLVACESTPPPPPEPPPPPPRDVVGELRREAASHLSVLEVNPVESAAVTHLLALAEQDEARGRHAQAERRVRQALEIEPENPRVWQLYAELMLRAQQYAEAERYALRAFDRSAQVGALCMRSWLTISEARAALDRGPEAAEARERAQQCPQKALPRL
jgi:tetratricopeptide (TPR) repeat protein